MLGVHCYTGFDERAAQAPAALGLHPAWPYDSFAGSREKKLGNLGECEESVHHPNGPMNSLILALAYVDPGLPAALTAPHRVPATHRRTWISTHCTAQSTCKINHK